MREVISVVLALVVGCGVTHYLDQKTIYPKAYEAGKEAGKGVLKAPSLATVYELKLVGVPAKGSEKYDEMERNGITNAEAVFFIPPGFKVGDKVVLMPTKGFVRVANK